MRSLPVSLLHTLFLLLVGVLSLTVIGSLNHYLLDALFVFPPRITHVLFSDFDSLFFRWLTLFAAALRFFFVLIPIFRLVALRSLDVSLIGYPRFNYCFASFHWIACVALRSRCLCSVCSACTALLFSCFLSILFHYLLCRSSEL